MDAMELFEEARRCSERIEELQCAIGEPPPSRSSDGMPRGGGTSDPTARMAEHAIDGVADMEREMESCQQVVGEALAIVDGLRRAFETPWWRAVELYYIDRLSWAQVAEEMGIPKRTCLRWRDSAFDWVDFVGVARARAGIGGASV